MKEYNDSITFGFGLTKIEIEVQLDNNNCLRFVGNTDRAGGQCRDTILEVAAEYYPEHLSTVKNIVKLWDEYHLRELSTKSQIAYAIYSLKENFALLRKADLPTTTFSDLPDEFLRKNSAKHIPLHELKDTFEEILNESYSPFKFGNNYSWRAAEVLKAVDPQLYVTAYEEELGYLVEEECYYLHGENYYSPEEATRLVQLYINK